MGIPIENYASPFAFEKSAQRRSVFIWAITFKIIALWVGAIFLAPIAKSYHYNVLADSIYSFFGYLCHQISIRSFHIDDEPFAVCARCFGIYFGLFLGAIIYPFIFPFRNTEPLPRIWLFISLAPTTIDFALGFFGIWANTHFSRLVTALIFGVTCMFYIIPALVDIGNAVSNKRTKS